MIPILLKLKEQVTFSENFSENDLICKLFLKEKIMKSDHVLKQKKMHSGEISKVMSIRPEKYYVQTFSYFCSIVVKKR